MDVGLTLERDVWLRSNQTNVEIAGELATLFNRPEGDRWWGMLEAAVGRSTGFGRRFEIQEGSWSSPGTPDQPSAGHRGRHPAPDQRGGAEITASLQGTLLQPSVSLGSDLGSTPGRVQLAAT